MKLANPKNRRFIRDQFGVGDRVLIQDPISKRLVKEGIIQSSQPTHTNQGARSYVVKTDEGKTYLGTLTSSPDHQALRKRKA